MKIFFTLLLSLASLSVFAADQPAPPPAPRPLLIQPAIRAMRRLPASALARQETADTPAQPEQNKQSIDLSGRWLLTLPAGYQYRVTFSALGKDQYRLQNAVAFSGVYQLNGEVLQLIQPTDERLNVFDWQLHNVNSMTLVDETGASGADYAGATLGRQIDWDDSGFPKKVVAIGRPAVPRPRSPVGRPVAKETTILGRAFNDEANGPYLETEETIIFVTGLDAWPDEAVGQAVTATGMIKPFLVRDGGETLRAQQLQVESWTLVQK